MKHLFTLLLLSVFCSAQAQYLLIVDGETPNPLSDKAGYNTISTIGTPLNTNNAVEFPTGNDYLIIDPFVDFNLNIDWTVSFDINVSNAMDSIYIIDWRSNNSTGHMHIGYNGNRGLYFSDRAINGIYGSLVDNPVPLPIDTWVHFDVEREGDSLFIHREGQQVASSYFTDALSPLSTTTIGYSQDFRYAHASFLIDNLTLTGSSITSTEENEIQALSFFPNPAENIISFKSTYPVELINVYDPCGKLIISEIPTENKLDVSQLESGIYFVELYSKNESARQQIIKK